MRLGVGVTLSVLLVACGGGSAPEGAGEEEGAPEPAAIVSREDVVTCLSDAGLEPEDTGLFIIGSAGTDVEAIGVRLDQGGRTLLFVFDDDAADDVDYVSENFATGYSDVSATGNVVVAFESPPAEDERSAVTGCAAA